MVVLNWLAEYWFDLIQTVGIVGSFLIAAHAIRKDERARTIGNTIALNEQYTQIWHEFYERPALSRILKKDVDLDKPVSDEETLFVKTLILHLDTVRRAMKAGIFAEIQGLRNDVRVFFTLPIPKIVWGKIKPFQDTDFVAFIDDCLKN